MFIIFLLFFILVFNISLYSYIELEDEPNTSAGGDQINLSVNFKTCKEVIENQIIYLSQKFINGTGGHNHSETVECVSSISRDLYSYCGDFNQWQIQTDRNGNATSTHTAPYYSGKNEIKAKTFYKTYEREHSKRIEIKVPNLVQAWTPYWLYLQPDNENCIHSNDIHYYNKNAWDAFKILAYNWYNSLHPNYKILKLTAGSLPWGGKFDDGVCWDLHGNFNHYYHRQGMDMDIGKLNFTDPNKRNAFEDLANRLYDKGEIFIEIDHQNNNHWHFR